MDSILAALILYMAGVIVTLLLDRSKDAWGFAVIWPFGLVYIGLAVAWCMGWMIATNQLHRDDFEGI
jgi:hypothetical protein